MMRLDLGSDRPSTPEASSINFYKDQLILHAALFRLTLPIISALRKGSVRTKSWRSTLLSRLR